MKPIPALGFLIGSQSSLNDQKKYKIDKIYGADTKFSTKQLDDAEGEA